MGHYFSEKQDSLLNLKKIKCVIRNREYEFYTGSGVFSKDKIDYGTLVLVEYMIVKGKVLDLGCGIGVVGKVASEMAESVVMVDVNERAIKLAKMNIKGLKNVIVKQSNIYEKVLSKFDTILLNPPQSAGKKVCFEMIEKALEHLNTDGSLQVVARHNKGGETLEKHMKEVFGNVKALAKKGGYRVYYSKKI